LKKTDCEPGLQPVEETAGGVGRDRLQKSWKDAYGKGKRGGLIGRRKVRSEEGKWLSTRGFS